jgi:hypothetical protein
MHCNVLSAKAGTGTHLSHGENSRLILQLTPYAVADCTIIMYQLLLRLFAPVLVPASAISLRVLQ